MTVRFSNPFKPGAGHMPPYLAGRENEKREFLKLLEQETILQNVILTGLRGLGKTVLLETFKPTAIAAGWLWVGTDLSESTSVNEENLAIRLLTDLSVVTSQIPIKVEERRGAGLTAPAELVVHTLDFKALVRLYADTPGLTTDKLKSVLETVWVHVQKMNARGVIFAYDEAQNLADNAAKDQFPLSVLLDVFQSIQRKGVRFMLLLTGLPTLFPKLVEARTYSERMFHIIFLDRLSEQESRDAILKPVEDAACPIQFSVKAVRTIFEQTRGYPFFIQYICRECFDIWTQQLAMGEKTLPIPVNEITQKLDTDFFAGRWGKATDRQRDLLMVISRLENCASEFTVQEIVEESGKGAEKSFSPSHVNQMLDSLSEAGLVYKNRRGKYSLAVPLLDEFIRRQTRN